MYGWMQKFKEVLSTVLPITALVIVLNLTFVPLSAQQMISFLLGALLIVIGMTIFLMGVDLSVSPLGNYLGDWIIRKNRVAVVLAAGLFLGFFISIAEPDLHILAGEVEFVTLGQMGKWGLVLTVSVGIAVMIAVGLLRVIFRLPLYILLSITYLLIFILALFVRPEILAIAFDSSGATTGAMTVPFILALALGVARREKGGKDSEKDSFGLVGIASAGAIISVLIRSYFMPAGEFAATIEFGSPPNGNILLIFINEMLRQAFEAALAILPLLVILLISRYKFIKLKRAQLFRMLRGFLLTWLGLVLLLTGVNAGFMEVGRIIGSRLAQMDSKLLLILIGFILGFVTILAEPAVHVLTRQIEDVTSGSVRRAAILGALSLGVGFAVMFSILRILIPPLQLWHILLPGYILSIILANTGSKLFVGIAFDSGGVASGPMTATFILAYAQGAANAVQSANVLIDGFGVIALVALTPLITLQILGIIYRRKAQLKGGISGVRKSD
ncbi:MAG TPA: DUF1538 domain-containing protein [Clostridiales bacterium]|nr:DUF1538 domain-containing protein [Clostridiales bacterium]